MTGTLLEQPVNHVLDSNGRENDVVHHVLAQLGTPGNLLRAEAKALWDNHFRVNIYCAEPTDRMVQRVHVAHSFFVTVAPEGIVCVPAVQRHYV